MDEIEPVLDTLYLLGSDTAAHLEIYFHETIKLLENGSWWSTNAPILISLIALIFTIGFSLYQLRKERKENKLKRKETYLNRKADREERILLNMPLIDFHFKYELNDFTLIFRNNGIGPAKIISLRYEYNNKYYDFLLELLFKEFSIECLKKSIKLEECNIAFLVDDTAFLKPGEEKPLCFLQYVDEELHEDFLKDFYKIEIIVEYENVFGDRSYQVSERFDHREVLNNKMNKLTDEYYLK